MNINYLKAEIIKNGYTLADVAHMIGISPSTLSRRIRSGVFKADEANELIKLLHIENPEDIFFDSK